MPGKPLTFREVFDREARGEFKEWSNFDDALWGAACAMLDGQPAVDDLPDSLLVHYATRLLEWDVGNGGFAQAAMNIPEWFETAAKGYEILGKAELAAFVREAAEVAESEESRIDEARAGGLEDAFEYFREGVFDRFDGRLDEVGWWNNDQARLAYVKEHRDELSALRPPDAA